LFNDAQVAPTESAQRQRHFEKIWASRDEVGVSVRGLLLVEEAAKELKILAEYWVWLMCLLGEPVSRDTETPPAHIDTAEVELPPRAMLPP